MSGTGIVTIDIGTTSMRAILFDGDGLNRAMSQRENPPAYLADGRVEQDAGTWEGILVEVLRDCASAAKRLGLKIDALSLTAQRSSVIPVDRDGRPLYPAVMWQDLRTQSLCARMRDDSTEVYRRTGLKISPVFSAIKMRWFREEEPGIYASTYRMAGIQDFVLFLLTGRFITDRSLASRTNLFNLRTLDWDPELIRLFGIDPAMLCDLVDQGSVCGHLLARTAQATGLSAGLPVISAGGDQQCAALGLGLLCADRIVANTGTGSYIIGHSDHPVLDEKQRMFCNVSAIPGAFILEAATITSGTVYKWFSQNFYGYTGKERDPERQQFADVNADAESSVPGSHGVILIPHFKGSGAPHWNPDSRGVFYNLTLSTTRGDMARAVLEGIASEMAENIDLVEELAGKIDMVRVSGGLPRFGLFNQIQADMYNRTVIRPNESEATALGAWISAATCIGIHGSFSEAYAAANSNSGEEEFHPVAENAAACKKLKRAKKILYSALDESGIFSLQVP